MLLKFIIASGASRSFSERLSLFTDYSHDKMSTSEASRNYRHYDIIFVILGNMRSFSTFCFWNTMASGASRIFFFTEYFARHGSKEIFNKDFNGHTIFKQSLSILIKIMCRLKSLLQISWIRACILPIAWQMRAKRVEISGQYDIVLSFFHC